MDPDDNLISSDTASLSNDESEEENGEGDIRFGINCSEKIIFIIDVNGEMARTYFRPGQKNSRSNLDWIKKGLSMFLKTKSILNSKHEYAIVALQGDAPFFLQELTNDISMLEEALRDVVASDSEEVSKKLYLDPVLELINTPSLRKKSEGPRIVANSVVRAVFIYCRPLECQLAFSKNQKAWDSLHDSPCFFFDSISLCEDRDQDKNFKWLQRLDQDERNYNLNIWRNEAQIFEAFAKLIAHPLQRTTQEAARYRVALDT